MVGIVPRLRALLARGGRVLEDRDGNLLEGEAFDGVLDEALDGGDVFGDVGVPAGAHGHGGGGGEGVAGEGVVFGEYDVDARVDDAVDGGDGAGEVLRQGSPSLSPPAPLYSMNS